MHIMKNKKIKVLVLNPQEHRHHRHQKSREFKSLVSDMQNNSNISLKITNSPNHFNRLLKNHPDICFIPGSSLAPATIPSGIDYPDMTVNVYGSVNPRMYNKAKEINPNITSV